MIIRVLVAIVVAFVLVLPGAWNLAQAQSLRQALTDAYYYNPTISSAQSAIRAAEEEVVIANSEYWPQVTANVGTSWRRTWPEVGDPVTSRSNGLGVTSNLNLFNRGQTLTKAKLAKIGIEVSKQRRLLAEAEVLLNTANAFMQVVNAEAVVQLQENNLKFLDETLQATRERFNVGEITLTDVAVAESRRAQAEAQLIAANATLSYRSASYESVVGKRPSRLGGFSGFERYLPKSLPDAIHVALNKHPQIVIAQLELDIANERVDFAGNAFLPRVDLQTRYSHTQYPETRSPSKSQDEFSVELSASMNIWDGGKASGVLRQEAESKMQAQLKLSSSMDFLRANISQSWAQILSSRAQIESIKQLIKANSTALNSVRQEAQVGQRTVLDVLNINQQLIDSETELVKARANLVMAYFAFLNSCGLLTADNLGIR